MIELLVGISAVCCVAASTFTFEKIHMLAHLFLAIFWCRKEIISFLKKSRGHETIVSNGNNQLRFNISRKLCWKTRRKSKLSILLSIKLFTVPQCSSKTSLWWGNFTKQLWQALRVLKSRYFFSFKKFRM